jgi:hypothetical protein
MRHTFGLFTKVNSSKFNFIRRPSARQYTGYILELRGIPTGGAPAPRRFEQGEVLGRLRAKGNHIVADDTKMQPVGHLGQLGRRVDLDRLDVR